jgi:hypothetical protein
VIVCFLFGNYGRYQTTGAPRARMLEKRLNPSAKDQQGKRKMPARRTMRLM